MVDVFINFTSGGKILKRITKQRAVIAACFSSGKRPLSISEIHALAARQYPSLGIATVYRAINSFVETGKLVAVNIGGIARYELANRPHHHHFYCQECDRAFCLEKCLVPRKILAPEGFTVRDHEMVVLGACPSCS